MIAEVWIKLEYDYTNDVYVYHSVYRALEIAMTVGLIGYLWTIHPDCIMGQYKHGSGKMKLIKCKVR